MLNHFACVGLKRCYFSIWRSDAASISPRCFLLLKNARMEKWIGPISYHLGCDFGRDEDGDLHFAPRKRIEKMEEWYFNMVGSKSNLTVMSPSEIGDNPELDTSQFLDKDGIQNH